ncbi:MAG: glycosyl hydrolase-related protein [Verrucomicrobiae bacterium]|nr:glycosyl hydrolase-related protein [Verrucomicrobiae bacterium]
MNAKTSSISAFKSGLVFGFDVGTGSIAWAVRRGSQFLDVGVLVCPEETARLDGRRALRRQRRTLRNKQYRRRWFARELAARLGLKLIRHGNAKLPLPETAWEQNARGGWVPKAGFESLRDPVALRVAASEGTPLRPEELFTALTHLFRRRGYLADVPWANREAEAKEPDPEKEKEDIRRRMSALEAEMQASGCALPCQLLAHRARNGQRQRREVWPRELVEREFRAILEKQAPHFPALAGRHTFVRDGRPQTVPVADWLLYGDTRVVRANGRDFHVYFKATESRNPGVLGLKWPRFGNRGPALDALRPLDEQGRPLHVVRKNNEAFLKAQWELAVMNFRVVDRHTGALKSLFDKIENRELLDPRAPWGLNEYLYVSGGEGSQILNCNFGTPPAQLVVDTPTDGEIVENVRTPPGHRIAVVARCKNTPRLRVEYRLYDALRRVDIVNTVEKEPTRAKEAVYFAFSFAAASPLVEYQIQNGWVRPNADQMPGACREWFTPQNLVHVRDGDFSVAWATPDAPLVTLTDINRGRWLAHLPLTNGHVFAYVMNNYWFTNYRAEQGGRFVFRFSLTTGRNLSREALAHFDQDLRTPVLAYPHLSTFSAAISQAGRPMPPSGASFLHLDAPNLEWVTLKAAEDGDGFILRLREVAGRAGEATLRLPFFRVREAWLCNGVEANRQRLRVQEAQSVRVPYGPNAFATVRLKLDGRGPASRVGSTAAAPLNLPN